MLQENKYQETYKILSIMANHSLSSPLFFFLAVLLIYGHMTNGLGNWKGMEPAVGSLSLRTPHGSISMTSELEMI